MTRKRSVRCMTRNMAKRPRQTPMIAYDIETTKIKANDTPVPLYWTMYGREGEIQHASALTGLVSLSVLLREHVLLHEYAGTRFVAWNANNFDVYFIAHAVCMLSDFTVTPFFANSGALRGVAIVRNNGTFRVVKGKRIENQDKWLFLDGIAMTGSVGTKLKRFIEVYAPELPKYELDLEHTDFDADNSYHRDYAMRDSHGLWQAMTNCEKIVQEVTGYPLQPTIGNLGVKFFQSRIPEGVHAWKPPSRVTRVVQESAMRGGYCWCNKQYIGTTWKYDLNQAYAAAMRDCMLPEGRCAHVFRYHKGYPGLYHCRIDCEGGSPVPFYCRDSKTGDAYHTDGTKPIHCWITHTEYETLRLWKWRIKIVEGYVWDGAFRMGVMVNELQQLRLTDPEGPSGPIGTVAKALGNNAYGKMAERLDSLEYCMAKTKPEGWYDFDPDDPNMQHVYFRKGRDVERVYHQIHIAAFITAHVRMVVWNTAMMNADAFIYADTDCVCFDREPVGLTVSPTDYGAYKVEALGAPFIFVAKKIYADLTPKIDKDGNEYYAIHAKGMRVKELTIDNLYEWYNGVVPVQDQVQRQAFLKTFTGVNMFVGRKRSGTNTAALPSARLIDGKYVPIPP